MMTSAPDRAMIILLVAEAVQAGARQRLACELLNITERTLERWKHPDGPPEDQRPIAP
jgi:putative transposase